MQSTGADHVAFRLSDSSALIDVQMEFIDKNVLGDQSGNKNVSMVIQDDKISFDGVKGPNRDEIDKKNEISRNKDKGI